MNPWSFASPHYKWGRDDFQGLVTLTLTLDRVILHTVMHHLSTSTYIPNCIKIEETFCGRTDVRTDIWAGFIRSIRKCRPNKSTSHQFCVPADARVVTRTRWKQVIYFYLAYMLSTDTLVFTDDKGRSQNFA